ncbi:hypothetical protein Pcinc_008923 [Petrolisthes cinctipes]|uniref:BHLH domain-containing protein n=1 Tax=Petrolisthes cinctipes TaxID=88211 RepID=A0AAE1G8D5_PETCI|nr:hypothetical protein Pcinc_008923 [Petrolisthes cinctipes]
MSLPNHLPPLASHNNNNNNNHTTNNTQDTPPPPPPILSLDERTSASPVSHQDDLTKPVGDDFHGKPIKNDLRKPVHEDNSYDVEHMQEPVGDDEDNNEREPYTDDSEEFLNDDMEVPFGDESYRGLAKSDSEMTEEEEPLTNDDLKRIRTCRNQSLITRSGNDRGELAGEHRDLLHDMGESQLTEPSKQTPTGESFTESIKQQQTSFTDESFTVTLTEPTNKQPFNNTCESSTELTKTPTVELYTEGTDSTAEGILIQDDPAIQLDDPEEHRSSSSPYSDENLPSVCCAALLGDLHHLSVYTPSAAPPTEETANTDDGLYHLSTHQSACAVDEGQLKTVKVYCLPSLSSAPTANQAICEVDERSTENPPNKLYCLSTLSPKYVASPFSCASVVLDSSYTSQQDDHTHIEGEGHSRLTELHQTQITEDSYTTQQEHNTQIEGDGHSRLTELHMHAIEDNSSGPSLPPSPPPATSVQFNRLRGKRGGGGKSYRHVPHREKPPHLVARRNARERRRVQSVNVAFTRLRRVVPLATGRSKRVSKVRVLENAITYISHLQALLRDCPSPSPPPHDTPTRPHPHDAPHLYHNTQHSHPQLDTLHPHLQDTPHTHLDTPNPHHPHFQDNPHLQDTRLSHPHQQDAPHIHQWQAISTFTHL